MKEKEWEKLLRIKTTGRDDTRSDTFRYPYEPTSYEVLERLANTGIIGKNNTLLDYGCGKGRVSIFMAYQTKCHSIGIEYDERIYNRALANKADTVSGNRVQFLCEDAVVFKIADNVDRFFFFNPFSIEIFKSVLANIIDSYYEAQAILNALVHRDYSIHTEGMPIQIIMFENRIEIRNPGGIYGRIRIDQLGKVQPDTRNPIIALELEVLKITENRYSYDCHISNMFNKRKRRFKVSYGCKYGDWIGRNCHTGDTNN